jgi:DNA-binding transcriptional ArsR family regulator
MSDPIPTENGGLAMADAHNDPIPEPDLDDVLTALHRRMRSCAAKVRMGLLLHLLYGPRDVTWLARAVRCGLPLVSVHLSALRAAGMVLCRKEKNRRVHSLSPVVQMDLADGYLHMRVRAGCGTAMTLSLAARVLRQTLGRPGAAGRPRGEMRRQRRGRAAPPRPHALDLQAVG